MITLRDIKNAEEKISPFILKTPQIYSSSLSSNSKNIYLKLESMQITGSFKLRGATNKLLHLTEEQKSKGVIAVSTGNHGKGVAHAAQKLGIKSKSFWSSIQKESSSTGGELMMVYMRHLLDEAKKRNIKISKNIFHKMGKDIVYYNGVGKWFSNINKYVRSLSKNVQISHYIISAGHLEILDGISKKKYIPIVQIFP